MIYQTIGRNGAGQPKGGEAGRRETVVLGGDILREAGIPPRAGSDCYHARVRRIRVVPDARGGPVLSRRWARGIKSAGTPSTLSTFCLF